MSSAVDPILDTLALASRALGAPLSAAALSAQTLRDEQGRIQWASVREALLGHGLRAELSSRALADIPKALLPAVLIMSDDTAIVLSGLRSDADGLKVQVQTPDTPAVWQPASELQARYAGACWLFQRMAPTESRSGLAEYEMKRTWLWQVLWRYRGDYLQAIVLTAVVNVLALVGSLYVMQIYDRVIPNRAFETLTVLTLGVVGAALFEMVARLIRAELTDVAGKKADLVISAALFRRVLAMDLGAKPASSGSYANNLRDFESVREFLTSSVLLVLADLPFVFVFIVTIFLFAGPLGWVPLLALPVVVLLSLAIQPALARATTDSMKWSSMRQGLAVEAIEGLETLKTHSGAAWAQQQWERAGAAAAVSMQKSKRLTTALVHLTQTLTALATVAIVFWGVHLVHHDNQAARITMGALIAAVILSGRALAPMAQITGLLIRLNQTRVALQGIDSMVQRPTERDGVKMSLTHSAIAGRLEARGLAFRYDKDQPNAAIDDVSFTIAPGERVAILGRVGSGKSTLLRLAAGLYQPQQGQALLDGLAVRQIDPGDLRSSLTLLSQSPRLFWGSLRDNLALACDQGTVDDAGLMAALRRFGMDDFVNAHPQGLNLRLGEDGQGLSGGQKQLVGLARLVLRAPSVALLDEPTSGLDQGTEHQVLQALAQWSRDGQRTLVLVTHRPQVLDIVDRVIVLERGRVVMDGPKAQVLQALAQGVTVATGARRPAAAAAPAASVAPVARTGS